MFGGNERSLDGVERWIVRGCARKGRRYLRLAGPQMLSKSCRGDAYACTVVAFSCGNDNLCYDIKPIFYQAFGESNEDDSHVR